MSIGQRPGVVRVPTFHVQLTRPRTERFGYKPAATDGPDLYSTVIEHVAGTETETESVAYAP
jgi:hypothetical protein